MPKTPPLIIPVQVDASGVDKGLSNINSRLKKGVSGGGGVGGGGGTAGGFGTGGGSSITGVGVIGAQVASSSILGNAFARGMIGGSNNRVREDALRRAEAAQARVAVLDRRIKEVSTAEGRDRWMAENARQGRGMMNPDIYLKELKDKRAAAAANRRAALGTAARLSVSQMAKGGAAGLGRAVGNLIPAAARPALAAAGVAGAAIGAPLALGYGGMRYNEALMGSDFAELKGSTNWGVLRAAQLRQLAAQKGRGTLAQNFMLGAEKGLGPFTGGGLSTIGNIASYGANATARGLGRMLDRPISGTAENILRLGAFAFGSVMDIGAGAFYGDQYYRDRAATYIGLD